MVVMKSRIIVSASISIMISLTQPTWSMEGQGEKENQRRNGTAVHSSTEDTLATKRSGRKRKNPLLIKNIKRIKADDETSNLALLEFQKEALSPKPQPEEDPNETLLAEAKSQFERGLEYYKKNDFPNAFPYFDEAAKIGNADAQHHLGICYAMGRGVKQDMRESLHWSKEAAAQGHIKALSNLAAFYVVGDVVPQNLKKSLELYEQAAQGGDKVASIIIADMGQGVPENEKDVKELLAKGLWNVFTFSPKEPSFAMNPLIRDKIAEMALRLGDAEAVRWFKREAEKGNRKALFYLGKCYLDGAGGIPKDEKEAHRLLRKAGYPGSSRPPIPPQNSQMPIQSVPQEVRVHPPFHMPQARPRPPQETKSRTAANRQPKWRDKRYTAVNRKLHCSRTYKPNQVRQNKFPFDMKLYSRYP